MLIVKTPRKMRNVFLNQFHQQILMVYVHLRKDWDTFKTQLTIPIFAASCFTVKSGKALILSSFNNKNQGLLQTYVITTLIMQKAFKEVCVNSLRHLSTEFLKVSKSTKFTFLIVYFEDSVRKCTLETANSSVET